MPKKILLADDSITIQKVVELTFSDADYEVTAVNNGAKAIAKLAEMRPDIILSDIIMPEKNGYEVCEYVKSHPEFRRIPVVLLTGTFEPFDPDRAEKAGCDAVVTKPFESQSLIQKVEELISQADTAPAPAAPEPEPEPEPAPSPWTADTEVVPLPSSPFSTSSGSFPTPSSEAFTHDSDIFGAPPAQLQRKAFARPAPADSERLQVLQVAQRDAELFDPDHRFGLHQRGDFLEALPEIAVLVERIDQQLDERTVAGQQVHQRELLVQVVAQGRRIVRRDAAIAVAVVFAALPRRSEFGRQVVVPLRRRRFLRGLARCALGVQRSRAAK